MGEKRGQANDRGADRAPGQQPPNLFGLRPTKGLSSIAGIVPLSHTQDVAGPIARTVRDLAIALDATVGPDVNDAATHILDGQPVPHFVDALDCSAMRRTIRKATRSCARRSNG